MSTPSDRAPETDDSGTSAAYPSPPDTPSHRRQWGWIAACGVLVLALVGVTIWALNVNSDLSEQRDATTQAQQEADELSSEGLDDLAQSAGDAGDEIAQAGSDAMERFQSVLADIKSRLSALADKIKPPDSGSESPDAGATPSGGAAAPPQEATPPASAPPAGGAEPTEASPVETPTP